MCLDPGGADEQGEQELAEKEFILQGFTARTHANAVREIFDVEDIQSVILSVAFVSDSGVQELATKLAPHSAACIVFAGIRNDITSIQGLTSLLNLTSNLFVVDTGSRSVLFHPKLYFVKGTNRAKLVIGSGNLTLGGLNNNIEAGMLIDFDLADESDRSTVTKIEEQFRSLANDYPENIIRVGAEADLDEMLANGRITDESIAAPPKPGTSSGSGAGNGNFDSIPLIKLKVPRLRAKLKKAKVAKKAVVAKPSRKSAAAAPVAPLEAGLPIPTATGVQFELVWESKALTRRDLNVPDGATTNKTGSISLDKGLLPLDVDHRHYFRETIFNQLAWSATNTATTEEAYAKFHLVIKGISFGEFDLRIGHTIGTESKAYKQNNVMTRLSWGPVKNVVGNIDLIDRTLSLFRDMADPTRFVLEID